MSVVNAYGIFEDVAEFTAFLKKEFPRRHIPGMATANLAESLQAHQKEQGMKDPLSNQIGGDHYKSLAIQPVAYIHANKIPFIEGSIIKYVTRWRNKGGLKDLEKAKHFIDLLIQLESSSTSL